MRDYITTYTGEHITVLSPAPESIHIRDIAHALSMMSRANGHFPQFYSVAQHSIDCAREALARGYGERGALACLLHDASEAYLCDVTRPVKRNMPRYMEAEKTLQDMIYAKYLGSSLTPAEAQRVKEVDDSLLFVEFEHFMGEALGTAHTPLVTAPDFATQPFAEVEELFLQMFGELGGVSGGPGN